MTRIVAAFVLSMAIAGGAWACSCRPPNPDETESQTIKRLLKENAAAFEGRVLRSWRTDPDINRGEVIARVRITKAYKGVRKGRIITLKTAPNGALCGLGLDKGSTFRIVADRSRDGTYSAGICSHF